MSVAPDPQSTPPSAYPCCASQAFVNSLAACSRGGCDGHVFRAGSAVRGGAGRCGRSCCAGFAPASGGPCAGRPAARGAGGGLTAMTDGLCSFRYAMTDEPRRHQAVLRGPNRRACVSHYAAQIGDVIHLRGREVAVHKSCRKALRARPSRAPDAMGQIVGQDSASGRPAWLASACVSSCPACSTAQRRLQRRAGCPW